MNNNIISYYQKLREDESLRAPYASCETLDDVFITAASESQKLGFTFTVEEARSVGFDIEALHNAASNDDALDDFELELVAAGIPMTCVNTSDV